MASGSAGSIFVDLLLRDAKYRDGLKKSKAATSDFAKGVKDLAREFAPLIGGAGFLAITNRALESADAVSKAAKSLGLSSDQFQKFSYAFKLGGIDAETFTAAIIKLNNNLAAGKLPYADTASAIFGISNRLKNAKDGIEATGIVSEAFGAKLGARLIPALSGGASEVNRLGKEAERLGLVFGGDLVKNAENFKDQIEILGEVITKNFQGALLKQFVGDSDSIRKIYTDPDFIDGVRGLGELFGALAQTLLFIGRNIDNVLAPARWLIENSEKLGQATGNFIQGRGFVNLPPNASFQRPQTVDQVTHNPAAIDAALKARGLPGLSGSGGDNPEINLKDINNELDDALKKIQQQTELLALQNDHFGENKNQIEAIVSLRQAELDLAAKGITLSDADRANLEKKLRLLAGEKDLQDDLKEAEDARVKAQKEILDRQEEERKRIADSIQDIKKDLAGEITDAIKGAQSLGDAFKNVAAKIAEAVTQAQILKLLSSAGLGGGDDDGGGFLGSLFGGGGIFEGLLSSFDVGSPFVPRDQIAKVHQGEMIIPRVQADGIRRNGGLGGGVTVNQYISTPDANSFQRSQNQILAQTQQQLARATRRNN